MLCFLNYDNCSLSMDQDLRDKPSFLLFGLSIITIDSFIPTLDVYFLALNLVPEIGNIKLWVD